MGPNCLLSVRNESKKVPFVIRVNAMTSNPQKGVKPPLPSPPPSFWTQNNQKITLSYLKKSRFLYFLSSRNKNENFLLKFVKKLVFCFGLFECRCPKV